MGLRVVDVRREFTEDSGRNRFPRTMVCPFFRGFVFGH
jgi:hypothetical protein